MSPDFAIHSVSLAVSSSVIPLKNIAIRRASKEDEIDHAAGIIIAKKTGDRIEKGDTLCTLYSNNEKAFAEAEKMYLSSLVVGKEKAEEKPLIYGIVR